MIIATSRFQAKTLIIESGLAPVGITLYRPRFPLSYELAGRLGELAPKRAIFRLEGDEFDEAYREQIDSLLVEQLREKMTALAGDAPGVVLLCFEPAGEPCHRRMFAAWWEERTGEQIPELGDDRCEHGMFRSGAGACPKCGGGAE